MDDRARPLDGRKSRILRALVSQYVQTGEPVGSKTLVERFRLGVSPATVRNELSALEDAGFIYQPHTSAGRVPTDTGYRFFVDTYGGDVSLPPADAARVQSFFDEPRLELEDALSRTAALLSNITRNAAVVFAPPLRRSIVRHVELIRLAGRRAMVVVVTDSGRVENHIVSLSDRVADVDLDAAARMLNNLCRGRRCSEVPGAIAGALDHFSEPVRALVATIGSVLADELVDEDAERVFLEGTSNIVDEHKFSDIEVVREVISALERRRLMLEVLAEALSSDRVSVRIGSENAVAGMQHCAVVTARYGIHGSPPGMLGIVGPTRMDYRRSIAAVHEVARSLGRLLSELGM